MAVAHDPLALYNRVREFDEGLSKLLCSRTTLVSLFNNLANLLLERPEPAVLFSTFLPSYTPALIEIARQIYLFGEVDSSPPNNVTVFSPPLSMSPFLVIVSNTVSTVLCSNPLDDDTYDLYWSFEPFVIETTLQELKNLLASHNPTHVEEIDRHLEGITIKPPDSTIFTRFAVELAQSNDQLRAENKQRQWAEQALMEERNSLRLLTDNLPDSIFVKDRDSRFMLVNSACVTFLGSESTDDIIGRTDFDFFSKKLAQQFYEEEQKIFSTGVPLFNKEYQIEDQNGKTRWISEVKIPVRDSAGEILGLVGVSRDVTGRKASEGELQQHRYQLEELVIERTGELMQTNKKLQQEINERLEAEQALAAERERLELTIQSIMDGVVALDGEQRIILANRVAQNYLNNLSSVHVGQQLTHLAGTPLAELLLPPPSGSTYHELSLGEPHHQTLEVVARPIQAGIQIKGWVLVIRDVTQERLVQKRIQQQDRLAAVGQLAAGIAHDFNNILTSIIGFAELSAIHPDIPSTVAHDLTRIVQQGKRAATLVKQILDFSRQSVAKQSSLDLQPFIKETCKLLERTIPEHIRIEMKTEPGEHLIDGNPFQLTQMITNLALNARDAMPYGGTLHISLSQKTLSSEQIPVSMDLRPGHWILLRISDTGEGIPADEVSHLFEPFFSTKELGTGLGLAQTYGIIKQHGGEIDVQSQLEQGTVFTIYLPPSATQRQVGPPEKETQNRIPQGSSELILIVEDDSVVLDVSKSTLQYLGYQVLTAINGRKALQIYEEHQNDIALVLTDITMPEMDGMALAQALLEKDPKVKIIALSGYSLEDKRDVLQTEGIVDWLQKPLGIEKLAQTVSRVLKK